MVGIGEHLALVVEYAADWVHTILALKYDLLMCMMESMVNTLVERLCAERCYTSKRPAPCIAMNLPSRIALNDLCNLHTIR